MSDSNINRTEGGGPWRLELPHDLATSGHEQNAQFDLTRLTYRGQKGYFKPWLPMDVVQVKNLNSSEALQMEYNGLFTQFVEPNAVESFTDAGVSRIIVENAGQNTIPMEDVVLTILVEPYGADDAAREKRQRHPAENMVRGFLNL